MHDGVESEVSVAFRLTKAFNARYNVQIATLLLFCFVLLYQCPFGEMFFNLVKN